MRRLRLAVFGLFVCLLNGCTLEDPIHIISCPDKEAVPGATLSYVVINDVPCEREKCNSVADCCSELDLTKEQKQDAYNAFVYGGCPQETDFSVCQQLNDVEYFCTKAVIANCTTALECINKNNIVKGICVNGSCIAQACETGYHVSGVGCLKDSDDNCGTKEAKCGRDERCIDGKCQLSCEGNLKACQNTCVDYSEHNITYCANDYLACVDGYANCNNKVEDGCEINILKNDEHCGACLNKCDSRYACIEGTCVLQCKETEVACGDDCADLKTNRNHCGVCENECGENKKCSDSMCVWDCRSDESVCPDGCYDLTKDPNNCGSCGNVCKGGYSCYNGVCELTCPEGVEKCDNSCVDLRTSNDNCGSCGNKCDEGYSCDGGECKRNCAKGEEICLVEAKDGEKKIEVCADLSKNSEHCGSCNNACSGAKKCDAGECKLSCADNMDICLFETDSDEKEERCTNLKTDPLNCSACGKSCETGQSCNNGVCVMDCPSGTKDCFDKTTNRWSCINTQSSRDNCGGCGNSCKSTETCENGVCKPNGQCGTFALCSSVCKDTQNDSENCGGCGIQCAANQKCIDGRCMQSCTYGTSCTNVGAGSPRCVQSVCVTCKSAPTNTSYSDECYSTVDFDKLDPNIKLSNTFYVGNIKASTTTRSSIGDDVFPRLREAMSIEIKNNSSITNVEFPELTEVERFNIEGNSALKALSFPKLVRVWYTSWSTIKNNKSLSSVDLSSLISVKYLHIEENESLKELIFSSLNYVQNSLRIWNNAALTTIQFPALGFVFAITVKENKSLTSMCVKKGYGVSGSGVSMTGNKTDTYTYCP